MEDNSNSQGGCQPANPQPESQQTGVIYKITNTLNGKIYVGMTRQKLSKRISKHKYCGKHGRPGVDTAIAKYGWENFTVEVIETCPVENLAEREIFWIAKLDANGSNGYNLTEGGDGCTGYKHTAESRAKISANHADVSGENNPQYGKPLSEEHKAKISASEKGKTAWNKGKKMSEEQKRNLSATRKGKPSPLKGKPRPPEVCAKIALSMKATLARKKLENGGNK